MPCTKKVQGFLTPHIAISLFLSFCFARSLYLFQTYPKHKGRWRNYPSPPFHFKVWFYFAEDFFLPITVVATTPKPLTNSRATQSHIILLSPVGGLSLGLSPPGGVGMVSQTAVTVVSAVTVIFSWAAFSTPPTLQALNCLPEGAVKVQAGSSYSPETPVASAIVPVPPLAAKDTV